MLVIFGNQLFAPRYLPKNFEGPIFMAEDIGLCTHERHHQQKLVLFLAAMRAYADELRAVGYTVHYELLDVDDTRPYEEKLAEATRSYTTNELIHFEIEDKAMEQRIISFTTDRGLDRTELPSPMFTCSREEFREFAAGKSRLLMSDFYKRQRQRLGILIDDDGKPLGGRWSYDTDNRKKLPRAIAPPDMPWLEPDEKTNEVIVLVDQAFASHPGQASQFCWPTTREQANAWLDDFIANRLEQFGPYEDAMTIRSNTLFHSVLSPCINLGLLTPDEIMSRVLQHADDIPLQSLEGFVRQVIGWREFIRGVYREYGDEQEAVNFWSHEREMSAAWYEGTTGILPLDDAIHNAQKFGWVHHIERLMVLGNLMTLCEVRPGVAHRWFMEMFVDSSEWVMGPNVYGMGLFSDGGIFATKPYICGSNYLRKMSDYSKGAWCDTVDGLYWRFIDKHRAYFSANPRLALMSKALDRLDPDRKRRICHAAESFLQHHTH